MITIPSLSDVTDILDTDQVMVTNAQGQSYKIAGSELNKRHKVIIASSTTVTGTPLKSGWPVRIYFTADITAANATTTMQINYNNVNYYVKAPKNGALVNFVANAVGNTYKYVQAYTTLELLYDGTQFVIVGNPIVISSGDYVIYADGNVGINNVYLNKYQLNLALGNTQSSSTQKGRWYRIDIEKGSFFTTIDGSMYDRLYLDINIIDSSGISNFTVAFREGNSGQIISHNYQPDFPELEAIIENENLYLHPLSRWGCNWYIKAYGSRAINKLSATVFDDNYTTAGIKPSGLTNEIITAL